VATLAEIENNHFIAAMLFHNMAAPRIVIGWMYAKYYKSTDSC